MNKVAQGGAGGDLQRPDKTLLPSLRRQVPVQDGKADGLRRREGPTGWLNVGEGTEGGDPGRLQAFGVAYRVGGDPGGEGSRMGTLSSVVGNGDRHMEMLSGALPAVGAELHRPKGLVGPALGAGALVAQPPAPPCPASSRRLLVPDLTCLSLLTKKGSEVVTGGSWPQVQQHGGPSAGVGVGEGEPGGGHGGEAAGPVVGLFTAFPAGEDEARRLARCCLPCPLPLPSPGPG